jgi:hypothetical protein
MDVVVDGSSNTAADAIKDIPEDVVKNQAKDALIKGSGTWWEDLSRDLHALRGNPLKAFKLLKETAIGTAAEAIAPVRDSTIVGTLMKSGADTRIAGALSSFKKHCEDVKKSSDTPLRWIKVSVFGFDFGVTLARAFLKTLSEEKIPGVEIKWVFAGLFDGVDRTAASKPILETFLPFRNDLDDGNLVHQDMQAVLHLIAAHERRFYRRARLIGKGQRGWREQLVPGVSEDVGGGLAPGEQKLGVDLSLTCLHAMYRAAYKAGVALPQLETLQEADRKTAELFVLRDQINQKSADVLVKHYARAIGEQSASHEGFTAHMRLYIRWLAHLWRDYSAADKRLRDEQDFLDASQYPEQGLISGMLGLPRESESHREERLKRTRQNQEAQKELQERWGWLHDVDREATSLRRRYQDYGDAAGGHQANAKAQKTLLNEWFANPPTPLTPPIRDLFTYYVHDKQAIEVTQQSANAISGENFFAIRGFDLPAS